MNKVFLLLILLSNNQLFGGISMQQLASVNKEWLHHQNEFKNIENRNIDPKNAASLIQIHLLNVVNILSETNNPFFSASAQNSRTSLLAKLKAYAETGIFPINTFLPFTNPVFIDDKGTHCAVGYLLQQSGNEQLAQLVNATQRFAYIKEIKNTKLLEWAYENGFTINELAWIQPGYAASTPMEKIAEGVNGTVRSIVAVDANTYIIGGDFTTEIKNNTTCNHIAMFSFDGTNWQITPLQNGLNGPVYALYKDNSKIWIGGNFTNANGITVKNIAQYDLLTSGQPYAALGNIDSTVLCITKYDNKIFAGGKFTDAIKYWDNNAWNNLANNLIAYGEIRTLEEFNSNLYIGGQFDVLTGAFRKNIVSYNTANGMQISNFGCPTPVNDFCIYKNELIAACDFIENNDTCAIAKLGSTNWEVIVKPYAVNWLTGKGLTCFVFQDTNLYVGGNFNMQGFSTSGNHLGKFSQQLSDYFIYPIATLDAEVIAGVFNNNKIFIVGGFIDNAVNTIPPNQNLNRIAYLNFGPSFIKTIQNDFIFSLFPNPTSASFSIQLKENFKNAEFTIIDWKGQLKMIGKVNADKINIGHLNIGLYQFVIYSGNKKSSLIICKQ
jgi:Secretion system C-terminal sorting domain